MQGGTPLGILDAAFGVVELLAVSCFSDSVSSSSHFVGMQASGDYATMVFRILSSDQKAPIIPDETIQDIGFEEHDSRNHPVMFDLDARYSSGQQILDIFDGFGLKCLLVIEVLLFTSTPHDCDALMKLVVRSDTQYSSRETYNRLPCRPLRKV